MASPNIRLLRLGFSEKSPSQVLAIANIVIDRIKTGECKIPLDPTNADIPTLLELEAQRTLLNGAITQAPGSAAAEARLQAHDGMVIMFQKLGSFYETKADGDRVLLATTGFEFKKESGGRSDAPTPVPTIFRVIQGPHSHTAIGKCKMERPANSIESQWSLNPDPASPDWKDNGITTKSQNIEYKDLPRGVDIYFRCRAHGPNGESGWSDIATLMVI